MPGAWGSPRAAGYASKLRVVGFLIDLQDTADGIIQCFRDKEVGLGKSWRFVVRKDLRGRGGGSP